MSFRLVKYLSAIPLILLIMFVSSRIWPIQTAQIMIAAMQFSAGLDKKMIETSFGPVTYLEGGSGPNVVLLHGIFARKEHWIDFSRKLTGNYRVIIPDLPGFGDNPPLNPNEYDYQRQKTNLLEFLDKMKFGNFHLAANSMGSQIAAMIAKSRPYQVTSLSFIGGPHGVKSPISSDMEQALEVGKTPLLVSTSSAYKERMNWLFPDPPYIPGPTNDLWQNSELSQISHNQNIWNQVWLTKTARLEELAPALTMPSLIIWCKKDRIFHYSGAQLLHKKLPDSRLMMPDNCGHLPMLDQPKSTAITFKNFLDEVSK